MGKYIRMGFVNRLHPGKVEEYKRLHAAVWPEVLQQISASHIQNYSIFLREPEGLLFGYFEYHGTDYDADMAHMAADVKTQEWWALTDPCQNPLSSVSAGENWADMVEVFHHD